MEPGNITNPIRVIPESFIASVKFRYRVAVSFTSKGMPSFDCTVEAEGTTMADVLAESDKLVAELKARYGDIWKEAF